MTMPNEWPLPMSLMLDREASFSPRQEFFYKCIHEMDKDNAPSFWEIANKLVEDSPVPERFHDDLVQWLCDGFDKLGDWRLWLLKTQPASTDLSPTVPVIDDEPVQEVDMSDEARMGFIPKKDDEDGNVSDSTS